MVKSTFSWSVVVIPFVLSCLSPVFAAESRDCLKSPVIAQAEFKTIQELASNERAVRAITETLKLWDQDGKNIDKISESELRYLAVALEAAGLKYNSTSSKPLKMTVVDEDDGVGTYSITVGMEKGSVIYKIMGDPEKSKPFQVISKNFAFCPQQKPGEGKASVQANPKSLPESAAGKGNKSVEGFKVQGPSNTGVQGGTLKDEPTTPY